MNEMLSVLQYLNESDKLTLAYLDPATTSTLIQIGTAVIVTVGTVLGIYRNKIIRFFKKKKDKEAPEIQEVNSDEKMNAEEKEVITADDLLKD